MSVSISQGNVDLDALIAGGDGFLDRIKTLKAAKDAHDKALEDLNMGRDAQRSMIEAQVREQKALDLIEAAKVDAAGIIFTASAQATGIINDAKAQADKVNQECEAARQVLLSWSDGVKSQANSILESAKEAGREAERVLLSHKDKSSQLASLRSELEMAKADAKAAHEEARAMQATLQSKLDAIKMAAS